MKQNIKKIIVAVLAAILALTVIFGTMYAVLGAAVSDTDEPIDTTKRCSLELTYLRSDKPFPGLQIGVYQVADANAGSYFTLAGSFAEIPVELNGIKSQEEWDEVCETVEAYLIAGEMTPELLGTTDQDGKVLFSDLNVGIYLVQCLLDGSTEVDDSFESFLISVPGISPEGKWIYDVSALPKPGVKVFPSTGSLSVTKLWRDNNHTEKRPAAIQAEIFRNGESYQTVTLSAENNWTYTWKVDGRYTWTVVETVVPKDYTVSLQYEEGVFFITNTRDVPDEPGPSGDTVNYGLYAAVMTAFGLLLVLVATQRKKHTDA